MRHYSIYPRGHHHRTGFTFPASQPAIRLPVARVEGGLRGRRAVLFAERGTDGVQDVLGGQLKARRHLHRSHGSPVVNFGERASHLRHSSAFQESLSVSVLVAVPVLALL